MRVVVVGGGGGGDGEVVLVMMAVVVIVMVVNPPQRTFSFLSLSTSSAHEDIYTCHPDLATRLGARPLATPRPSTHVSRARPAACVSCPPISVLTPAGRARRRGSRAAGVGGHSRGARGGRGGAERGGERDRGGGGRCEV